MNIFTVYVLGFGDNEDAYYACGTFKSREGAKQKIKDLVKEWEEDGNNEFDLDYYIEEHELFD